MQYVHHCTYDIFYEEYISRTKISEFHAELNHAQESVVPRVTIGRVTIHYRQVPRGT